VKDDVPDISEWFALAVYYYKSFAFSILVLMLIGIWLKFGKWGKNDASQRRAIYFLLSLPFVIWIAYFTVTAKEAYALTSLDSENNLQAEAIYKNCFSVSLKEAVKIAINDNQTGNVRFYASCRIADLIANNSPQTKKYALEQVANAAPFLTGFGGTNDLTCGYFIPNRQEGPFTVTEIITRRLEGEETGR